MLLGYYPAESLVVSFLTGDGSAVGLTLRFDLDGFASPGEAASELVSRGEKARAVAAFLAVYTDERFFGDDLPHLDLMDELVDHPALGVREALLVRGNRWWSYLCAGMRCCPPEGTPFGPDSAALTSLEASLVLSGSAVLTDRNELVASIATEASAANPAQRRRMTMARKRVEAMPPEERRTKLAGLIEMLVVFLADPRGVMTDREAAEIAALCGDIGARDDLLIEAISPRRRDEVLTVLRAVVRRVPSPHDAPVCAVLAWFAYAAGDGTLVNIALDRALGSDPTHSLALLIETSLEQQLPPSMIEEVVRGAARDIAARDAAG